MSYKNVQFKKLYPNNKTKLIKYIPLILTHSPNKKLNKVLAYKEDQVKLKKIKKGIICDTK